MSNIKFFGHPLSDFAVKFVETCQISSLFGHPVQVNLYLFRVGDPVNLLADGVALHPVKVVGGRADAVEELGPQQLTLQQDGWLSVLAALDNQ